jgi:hypothetical protein
MGVSIHYRGRINNITLIPRLCEEIRDIADSMGWPSTTIDDDWSDPTNAVLLEKGEINGNLGLKGIQFTPRPNSESFSLFFDHDGHLLSPMSRLMINDGHLLPEATWISIKTQFAGPDTHVWIIGLLKYLKKCYISDLEVSDESEYWETGDRGKLESKMELLNKNMQELTDYFSSAQAGSLTCLSADEIAEKIMQKFINRKHR